jgi:hypothetical protein
MAPIEKTALECVMEVDHERIKLEAEAERLAAMTDDDGKTLMPAYESECAVLLFLNLNFPQRNTQSRCKREEKERTGSSKINREAKIVVNDRHHRNKRYN